MTTRHNPHLGAADWNGRLLEAVFSTRLGQGPVRIINATDAYLAHVIGLPSNSEAAARQSFISAIKAMPHGARKIFDYDLQMALWHRQRGAPTFFLQLYLSLLAASATEDTHEEGDFRRRYCLLLDLPAADYVSNGLPRLWEELARWTNAEAKTGNTVRRLVLPDPGYETIIGYPKRLAFPGFKDLGRLATLLFDSHLTSESPLDAILDVLAPQVPAFSSSFQSEYAHLRRALDADPENVFLLPLWAALEAASFAPRGRRVATRPKFALELSFDDFGRAIAFLLTDAESPRTLQGALRLVPASQPIDECKFEVTIPERRRAAGILPELLKAKSPARRLLDASPMRRQLEQSCLVFAPDQDVPWLWRASRPIAGPALFLCNDLVYKALSAVISTNSQCRVSTDRMDAVPGWTVVMLSDCAPLREHVDALSDLHQYDAFRSGVSAPRLTVRGAVQVPEGVLLNTASRPEVIAVGCERVNLGVSYEAGSVAQLGGLAHSSETGAFRPTADQVNELALPAVLSLTAYRGEDLVASRELIVTSAVPLFELSVDPGAADYLEESRFGQYAAPGTNAGSTTEWLDNPNFEAAVSCGTQEVDSSESAGPESILLDPVLPMRWDDLIEALYGLFANAMSCSDDRLEFLSEALCSVQPELNRFSVSTHLWHNFLLYRLWHRRWRGRRYFPVPPALEFDSQEATGRLVGLAPRTLRDRFRQVSGVSLLEPSNESVNDFPKCIEATVLDHTAAQTLAASLQIPLVEPGNLELPPLSDLLSRIPARYRAGLAGLQTQVWSPSVGAFLDTSRSESPVTLTRTDFERSQSIYELVADDRVLWATESRAWALFAHRCLSGQPALVTRGSSIVSLQPLPVLVAMATRSSGGRTYLAPGYRGVQWVYQFGSRQALSRFLAAWAPQAKEPALPILRWAASARATARPLPPMADWTLSRRYGNRS